MIDMKYYKKFLRFLKEKQCYVNYIKNVENCDLCFFTRDKTVIEAAYNEREFIDLFDWSESSEGHDFWNVMDEEWRNSIIYE